MSLLPPNASPLALALDDVLSLDTRLAGIEAITGAKLDAIAPYLPWLVWEYGLGELLPYLPDARQAIRDGVAWQRLRGTPKALATALSWRGFDGAAIEESGPGFGFARFQLDPGVVPAVGDGADIIALARLAAPARARLVRLYHDLDLRAAHYDTPLDRRCLYDDWSGVDLDGVRQSFRTVQARAGLIPAPEGVAGRVLAYGMRFHRDPLRRWDLWPLDGAAEPALTAPAQMSVQSWRGVRPDERRAAPTRWVLPMAVLADGVPYDSLHGVFDGWAVPVESGPAPLYDGTSTYDAATSWRWLAANARRVDAVGAATPARGPSPMRAPVLAVETAIHFSPNAKVQRYDTPDAPTRAGRAGRGDATGEDFGRRPAPWGAGPWLDQAWGNSSGSVTMEVMA